tara:strand:+ start:1382 stop:1606 length:225 start_codon:yes stop_codon:yes gene_type:complete
MKLHDTSIAQISKVLQMAILTGTDIVDHLRMVTLEVQEDGMLYVEKEYQKIFDDSINKMLSNVPKKDEEIQDEH